MVSSRDKRTGAGGALDSTGNELSAERQGQQRWQMTHAPWRASTRSKIPIRSAQRKRVSAYIHVCCQACTDIFDGVHASRRNSLNDKRFMKAKKQK
jgi:hypothetical protein